MSIDSITFYNTKSLKNITINLDNINCLLGENGSGKSNILKSIYYFYINIDENNINDSLKNVENPFINYFCITFKYNMTRMIKILNSHKDGNRIYDYKFSNFYKRLNQILIKYSKNNYIELTLRQNKQNHVDWSIPYEDRCFLKSLFPIYHIDSRNIELTNWHNIWDIIGDLGKLKQEEKRRIRDSLQSSNIDRLVNFVNELFEDENIQLKKFKPKEFYSRLYQLIFDGDNFNYNYKKLDYFSDGFNSFNFMNSFVKLVFKLSNIRIKEPLVIIDEPEIGLHPKLIDKFTQTLTESNGYTNTIMSTHSPRLIKNILSSNIRKNVYHISFSRKNETNIRLMKSFTDKRQSNVITDQEASYYFSKGIVFLEGVTEIELFKNKNITNLFPDLEKLDLYSFDGNAVKIKNVHPLQKNIGIPYLLVTDLDKILTYESDTKKFKLLKENAKFVNPLKNKDNHKLEYFLYGDKRYRTLTIRKRIEKLIEKSYFLSDQEWGTIHNNYYELLKSLIVKYCEEYKVFPVSTTIEGALIHKGNHHLLYSFYEKNYKNTRKFEVINLLYNKYSDDIFKATLLRFLHDGKCDNLLKKDALFKSNNSQGYIYNLIKNNIISKTSGWVTEFINYYFINEIDGLESRQEKLQKFRKDFPELFAIIINMLKLLRV